MGPSNAIFMTKMIFRLLPRGQYASPVSGAFSC
jgi:hypothetical protein